MSTLLLTAEEWTAVGLSLRVALVCVIVSAVPGVLCGWFLARWSFPGKTLVDALVHLPLVVPPVVTGYLLLLLLGRGSVVGRWLEGLGIDIAFTFWAAVIASAVMGFPLLSARCGWRSSSSSRGSNAPRGRSARRRSASCSR